MVETQVAARGIRDAAVLRAMRAVPREVFVPPELRDSAYRDSPLPIAEGQVITQPYLVAHMTAALELSPGDRVLEIGTGSGYAAAVLAEIAGRVYTVERHESLASAARRRLEELGYENVEVRVGDGTLGWPEHGPYQAISVTAGGPDVPRPLLEQLVLGGRLVIPLGPDLTRQTLVQLRRRGERDFSRTDLDDVRFVPLVGAQGWEAVKET